MGVNSKRYSEHVWIAKAGIAGIAVFALFSYPAQILPIKLCLTLYLAILSSLSERQTWQIRVINFSPVKYILAIGAMTVLFMSYKHLNVIYEARKDWNTAYRLYRMTDYAGCLPHYEKAWSVLHTNGDYLTNYGKALSMAGEHAQAVTILQQAGLYYPNIVVYTALGDSYKALGKPVEAGQSYLTAWHMNPSRFYPKYLLAKLYAETGQTDKAKDIARELLNKDIKVVSTAVDEIRKEMEKVLSMNNE